MKPLSAHSAIEIQPGSPGPSQSPQVQEIGDLADFARLLGQNLAAPDEEGTIQGTLPSGKDLPGEGGKELPPSDAGLPDARYPLAGGIVLMTIHPGLPVAGTPATEPTAQIRPVPLPDAASGCRSDPLPLKVPAFPSPQPQGATQGHEPGTSLVVQIETMAAEQETGPQIEPSSSSAPAITERAGPQLLDALRPSAPGAPANLPLPIAPVGASVVGTVPSVGQDLAALVERLAQARQAARGEKAELTVPHHEFGSVSLVIEQTGTRLKIALASADPGFAPIAQAALAERSVQQVEQAARAEAASQQAAGNSPQSQHQARQQPASQAAPLRQGSGRPDGEEPHPAPRERVLLA